MFGPPQTLLSPNRTMRVVWLGRQVVYPTHVYILFFILYVYCVVRRESWETQDNCGSYHAFCINTMILTFF